MKVKKVLAVLAVLPDQSYTRQGLVLRTNPHGRTAGAKRAFPTLHLEVIFTIILFYFLMNVKKVLAVLAVLPDQSYTRQGLVLRTNPHGRTAGTRRAFPTLLLEVIFSIILFYFLMNVKKVLAVLPVLPDQSYTRQGLVLRVLSRPPSTQ